VVPIVLKNKQSSLACRASQKIKLMIYTNYSIDKEDNKELIIFPNMYVNETPFFNEKVSIAHLNRNINSFKASPPKVIYKDHIQWE
jgi:hypothetical protein